MSAAGAMWLAPLRGVTIRAFRETFAGAIREAGFTGAVAPFIPANPGFRASRKIFSDLEPFPKSAVEQFPLVPQVIGKDPASLRDWCKAVKDLGFDRADLNAGCPFPMIVRRGRGSGLFRTPDVLERLLEVGCDEMGAGRFSLKTRLGLARPDELRALMPMINRYPLAMLTVHARTAKQMYEGEVDRVAFGEILSLSKNPVVYNGDLSIDDHSIANHVSSDSRDASISSGGLVGVMVGRGFVRALGARDDAHELLRDYIARSRAELCGDHPVLGRMKELLSYWSVLPEWRRLWPMVKICRSVDELLSLI